MTKTFRDNCDKNIVQQTSCEPLFPDVPMQLKMYFFVPFVRPCTHHNYGGISESHACMQRLCVAYNFGCRGLYNLPWIARVSSHESWLIRFNITFLYLRLYQEKICTCFSKDAEGLITYGCVLWRSQIVYFFLVLWTLQPHFTLWLSARTLQCLFV